MDPRGSWQSAPAAVQPLWHLSSPTTSKGSGGSGLRRLHGLSSCCGGPAGCGDPLCCGPSWLTTLHKKQLRACRQDEREEGERDVDARVVGGLKAPFANGSAPKISCVVRGALLSLLLRPPARYGGVARCTGRVPLRSAQCCVSDILPLRGCDHAACIFVWHGSASCASAGRLWCGGAECKGCVLFGPGSVWRLWTSKPVSVTPTSLQRPMHFWRAPPSGLRASPSDPFLRAPNVSRPASRTFPRRGCGRRAIRTCTASGTASSTGRASSTRSPPTSA